MTDVHAGTSAVRTPDRGTESSLPPATSTALRPGVIEGPDPHSNQADELRITPSKSKRRRLGT
eukprot:4375258-Prymnesium_polylepis.1